MYKYNQKDAAGQNIKKGQILLLTHTVLKGETLDFLGILGQILVSELIFSGFIEIWSENKPPWRIRIVPPLIEASTGSKIEYTWKAVIRKWLETKTKTFLNIKCLLSTVKMSPYHGL